jgi:hypothetical protein
MLGSLAEEPRRTLDYGMPGCNRTLHAFIAWEWKSYKKRIACIHGKGLRGLRRPDDTMYGQFRNRHGTPDGIH